MRILAKAPRCPLHVEHVSANIEALQEVIRGCAERMDIEGEPDWCIIYDSDAQQTRIKEYNVTIGEKKLFGKIAIVGLDEAGGFSDLGYKLDKRIKELYPNMKGV